MIRAEVLQRPDGRSKGCGLVEYDDIDDAARALSTLNGMELKGRRLYVREDRDEKKSSGVNNGPTSLTQRSREGLQDAEVEVIYLNTPRLYVSNLSWDVQWQDLKDWFKQVNSSNSSSKNILSCRVN